MNGIIRILRRFISATIMISVFLLILNFALLGIWIFGGMNRGQSPDSVVQNVAEGLHNKSNSFFLDEKADKLLVQNHAWAMLLDKDGNMKWSYSIPAELPHSYTITDIAQLSRNYLMDYPVFVWKHDNGLVIVGYPKNSIAKYQLNYPIDLIKKLPVRSALLLIVNILLAMLLSIIIGSQLIKSIKPLVNGISSIAEDQPVNIIPKGVLSSIASSINHTSELLQKKNSLLKARDEARSNWIAGISHDIRTPLSMVLGYAGELEESQELPEMQRQKAGIIRKQGEKLRSLVSDLNLVSMLEYEMQPINSKPLKLSALVRQTAAEFINNGLDQKFNLELDMPDEDLKIKGDEKLLLRAASNLVQNCIDHNPGGCSIVLRTFLDQHENNCHLIVSDNGKGIPADHLSNLIELPYSSKRKNNIHNGHGLGLPMVSRIAKAHHGELILTSSEGMGLCADIEIPIFTDMS